MRIPGHSTDMSHALLAHHVPSIETDVTAARASLPIDAAKRGSTAGASPLFRIVARI
jgi:hypothetical protein